MSARSRLPVVLWLCLTLPAFAGSRARVGGTLKIATASRAAETDPLLADTPLEATLVSLLNHPICRLEHSGTLTPVLTSELTHSTATSVRFTPRTELADFPQVLTRIAAGTSPYRALLAPLKAATATELTLAFAFPDFDRALCHSALAPIGVGPYRFASSSFTANVFFPEGRPFLDTLTVTSADPRTAERLLQQHKASLVLGLGPTADEGNLLYATYLAFNPARCGPEFRAAFESAVERSDLTRFFVHPPAAPMLQLLPPTLAVGMADPAKLTRPAAPAVPRELTLLYDAALEDHRAVAQRLQVKLHALGYRIALRPLSRAALRSTGPDFDLILHSVLVPPVPSLAIALALELGGRHDQLTQQLTPLGAIADDKARARAAQTLAEKLWPDLPLIPLYAQGLAVQGSRELQNLKTDAQGLPQLDFAFLGSD